MLHKLSENNRFTWDGFTDPFRYSPHPLVRKAAEEVLSKLEKWKQMPGGSLEHELERSFAEGKMLGVLVCRIPSDDSLYYLAAFSGTVQGADGDTTANVHGFVPPIIDLTDPDGYFKAEEKKISEINQRITALTASEKLSALKKDYSRLSALRDSELANLQAEIQFCKKRREEIRCETSDPNILAELIKESQFQKAELKRLKDKWKVQLESLSQEIYLIENSILELKSRRAEMSDNLQRWIFQNAVVHNALGVSSSIWNLFQNNDLIPPGGTGECAGPKLLEYAYRNGLQPLAMGEFWYGQSPDTAVRTHGHFYPSCTSKCGPLLGYMMKGLVVRQTTQEVSQSPVIIYEDASIIVAEKPSGMPSVPGLDGRLSLQEWLSRQHNATAVHRLDMDTSGIMVFAKTRDAEINLKKQFEEHTVRKTYIARLTGRPSRSADPESPEAQVGGTVLPPWPQGEGPTKWEGLFLRPEPQGIRHGSIDLPLSPDYDERPRQKVDFKQGKPAYTEYEIIQNNPDGTIEVLLYPHTGRTHQLRVHCAHTLGLGYPIVGDLLYGAHTCLNPSTLHTSLNPEIAHPDTSHSAVRLHLHALSITFRHPLTGSPLTFTSKDLCW